jgi:membrane protein
MNFNIKQLKNKSRKKLVKGYRWANQYSGGVVGILNRAFKNFSSVNGAEGAASVAYFVFFSIIPLLLLLVSIAGYLLVGVDTIDKILNVITQEIPLPRDLIESNLRQLLRARNIGGAVALIGLAWAASGSFLSLTRNINLAWPNAKRFNVIQGRLFALAIIAALVLLIVIWYAATVVFEYASTYGKPLLGDIAVQKTLFWKLSTSMLPWVLVFFAFLILYRWVPNTRVKWSEALGGTIPATVTMFLATRLFAWFLSTGVVNFQLVYGSLGTILAFLTWVYITAFIAIFGAHICSSIAKTKRPDDFQAAIPTNRPNKKNTNSKQ